MPESKKRKTATSPYSPPPTKKKKGPSPVWLAPLMLVLFGIGVLWLVVFYIANGDMPVLASIGNGHLLIGFGFIVAGFALSTQWR